jgi:hypothetical protein
MKLNEASRGFGVARKAGNADVIDGQISFLEKLIKLMKKSKFSPIDSKAKEQAKHIARIEKAMREIDDAVFDLQIIKKHNK